MQSGLNSSTEPRNSSSIEASPSGLRTLDVVGHPAGPDDIADAEGHLASAYGAVGRTLVLIRPDGYVALALREASVSARGRTTAV